MKGRDTKIHNHLKELKKDILNDVDIRDIDFRGTQFLPNIIMYRSFEWCFQKSKEELQQRKGEMEERILTASLQRPDDLLRLMNDRCMLTCLNIILNFDEKVEPNQK